MSTPTVDYDALAKQYGATSSQPAQSAAVDYDALAKQYGATSSQPPQSAQQVTPQQQAYRKATASGPFAPAGGAEQAMADRGVGDVLKNAGKAIAQGATYAAPVMTGGASLPVQSLVQGTASAADTAAQGGSLKDTAISGAVGAAIPPVAEFSGVALAKLKGMLPANMKQTAGQLFQTVAKDANDVPVSLNKSESGALQLMDWQKKTQLGPTINKFLNRITNPKFGPLTYKEAREYQQLLGALSADENMKMAQPVRRALTEMVVGLKQDVGDAAGQVGHAADYYKAMGDYATASHYQEIIDNMKDYAKKAAIASIPGAGVYYGVRKVLGQ